MLAMAMSLLVVLGAEVPDAVKEIYEVSCFNDGTVIGVTGKSHVARWEGAAWRSTSIEAARLWHSPDDRMFAVGFGPIVEEVGREATTLTRWAPPKEIGYPRLTVLDGIVAVTRERMFRLAPGGRLIDIGQTPLAPDDIPRIPVVFAVHGRLIACYQTSRLEADSGPGACLAPPPNRYWYRAEFGESFAALDLSKYVEPFACGGAIVSVHKGVTRARDLMTGKILGTANVGALLGSSCLAGNRAVLVGEHDISIVEVPRLRAIWRQTFRRPLGNAAICGNRVAFVRERETDVNFIDLPAAPSN